MIRKLFLALTVLTGLLALPVAAQAANCGVSGGNTATGTFTCNPPSGGGGGAPPSIFGGGF